MAFLILSIFLFSTVFFSDFLIRESVQKRVSTIDDFVFSTEKDFERQLFINGFRTLFAFESDIVESGQYLNDVQGAFQESFFNGTIFGAQNNLTEKTDFYDIKNKIERDARKVSVNISLTNPVLNVVQESPWRITYILNVDFYAYDLNNLASWNKTLVVKSDIPIETFSDPVYVINTNGLVLNKVVKTPFSDFVSGTDVSNLLNHTLNSYYINSSSGPSFLKRLEGDLSADANGIESLVNLEELSSQGIAVKQKSAVDYIYFSSNNPTGCNVVPAGMPSWFKLDNEHLEIYEVSCLS